MPVVPPLTGEQQMVLDALVESSEASAGKTIEATAEAIGRSRDHTRHILRSLAQHEPALAESNVDAELGLELWRRGPDVPRAVEERAGNRRRRSSPT